ncbi:hypothetical protein SFRURICE_000132 [Spodoptera frugiperda]|nr:hypothetical protein SFRURICE_000132 [Spodoptera frugiperda]
MTASLAEWLQVRLLGKGNTRVGRIIAGLFSVFRKFLMALRGIMCTAAYPFGDKERDDIIIKNNHILEN